VTPGCGGRVRWGAFIGGAFAGAGDDDTFAVTEPATGREIARPARPGGRAGLAAPGFVTNRVALRVTRPSRPGRDPIMVIVVK
jgi:hypothetical protein